MTDDIGQAELRAVATRLVDALSGCPRALRHRGGVQHVQHNEYASRARSLAGFPTAVLRLGDAGESGPAFALLRTALEHSIFDRLLFRATRHEQRTDPIDDATWARWQAERPSAVIEWERLPNRRVRILWDGPRVHEPDGRVAYTISVYYRWWREYDPFAVPGRSLDLIAAGHPRRRDQAAQHASVQQEIWRMALAAQPQGEPAPERAGHGAGSSAVGRTPPVPQRLRPPCERGARASSQSTYWCFLGAGGGPLRAGAAAPVRQHPRR